jgi:hypothetical protein
MNMNNVPSVTASTGRTICRLFAGILCMVSLPSCELAQRLTSPSGQPTVTITPNSAVRDVGETQQFTAQVTGGNSSEASATTVEWQGDNIAQLAGNVTGRSRLFTCADVGSGTVFAVYRTGVLGTTEIAATATLVCLRPPPQRTSLVILSPEILAFQIITACTARVIGVINIRNVSGQAITLGFRSNHRAVSPFVEDSGLQPDAVGNLGIVDNCLGEPVDATITVTATAADGRTDTQTVRVEGRRP